MVLALVEMRWISEVAVRWGRFLGGEDVEGEVFADGVSGGVLGGVVEMVRRESFM